MNYIKTERFLINPHNASGSLIVIKTKHTSQQKKHNQTFEKTKILTTESIEYYMKYKQERRLQEEKKISYLKDNSIKNKINEVFPPTKKIKKSWLIEDDEFITDDYIFIVPRNSIQE